MQRASPDSVARRGDVRPGVCAASRAPVTAMTSLADWRAEFPILATCTYLVNHSLGAMPRAARAELNAYADAWEHRGVRAWHEGWWEMGRATGDLLAPTLGVRPGTISMHQNVAVALGVIASCYDFSGRRNRVVLSEAEFPSTVYFFDAWRHFGAEPVIVEGGDGVHPPTDALLRAIDDRTALVVFSYVLFRSSAIQDADAIVARARHVGAHVIADVYQAAGTVPLSLDRLGVEYAVGGSVKWLCGGPGAGYLYVRPDLAPALRPAMIGWAAHARPFAFEVGPVEYGASPERFQSGTPNVPALYAARAGYRIIAEIGVPRIRERSLALTRRILTHADARGYGVHTPREDAARGGTVTIAVPEGEAVTAGLIARQVIVDHRPGAGIRIAPHFYSTEGEIDHALAVLDSLVDARRAASGR
jgi:kynureninase